VNVLSSRLKPRARAELEARLDLGYEADTRAHTQEHDDDDDFLFQSPLRPPASASASITRRQHPAVTHPHVHAHHRFYSAPIPTGGSVADDMLPPPQTGFQNMRPMGMAPTGVPNRSAYVQGMHAPIPRAKIAPHSSQLNPLAREHEVNENRDVWNTQMGGFGGVFAGAVTAPGLGTKTNGSSESGGDVSWYTIMHS
jgi:hypothetical protein